MCLLNPVKNEYSQLTVQAIIGLYILSQTIDRKLYEFDELLEFTKTNTILYTGLKCYISFRDEMIEKKEMFLDLTHIWDKEELNRTIWDYLFLNCLGLCTHFELVF